MKPNSEYSKACAEREVPYSVIEKVYFEIKDKSPEEQDSIRSKWAKIIEETYPYRQGREPAEISGNEGDGNGVDDDQQSLITPMRAESASLKERKELMDDSPWYPIIYRKGERGTEAALRLGFITEKDIVE